jgi:hypothetical protein
MIEAEKRLRAELEYHLSELAKDHGNFGRVLIAQRLAEAVRNYLPPVLAEIDRLRSGEMTEAEAVEALR